MGGALRDGAHEFGLSQCEWPWRLLGEQVRRTLDERQRRAHLVTEHRDLVGAAVSEVLEALDLAQVGASLTPQASYPPGEGEGEQTQEGHQRWREGAHGS